MRESKTSSKLKRFGLPLVIVGIGMVTGIVFNQASETSGPIPTPSPSPSPHPSVSVTPISDKFILVKKKPIKRVETYEPSEVIHEEQKPVVGNIEQFNEKLAESFKTEGMDQALARNISKKIQDDFKNQGSLFDMSESIRSALEIDADDVEVEAVKQLVLKAATESFDEMVSRGELTVTDPS